MSDTPITITFQASRELHGWLSEQAKRREASLGSYVRGLCIEERDRGVIWPREAQREAGGVLTVTQAKRRARR